MADHAVLLHDGRLLADGTPEELWTRPPNAWTAAFLGFRNIAPARLTGGVLDTPWGRIPVAPAALAAAASRLPADGDVTVVLRPAGLVSAPDGPIRGRVVSRRFRGDHVLLGVEVPRAPILHVEARDGDLPCVGDAVALVPVPGGVHVIDEASALPSGA